MHGQERMEEGEGLGDDLFPIPTAVHLPMMYVLPVVKGHGHIIRIKCSDEAFGPSF